MHLKIISISYDHSPDQETHEAVYSSIAIQTKSMPDITEVNRDSRENLGVGVGHKLIRIDVPVDSLQVPDAKLASTSHESLSSEEIGPRPSITIDEMRDTKWEPTNVENDDLTPKDVIRSEKGKVSIDGKQRRYKFDQNHFTLDLSGYRSKVVYRSMKSTPFNFERIADAIDMGDCHRMVELLCVPSQDVNSVLDSFLSHSPVFVIPSLENGAIYPCSTTPLKTVSSYHDHALQTFSLRQRYVDPLITQFILDNADKEDRHGHSPGISMMRYFLSDINRNLPKSCRLSVKNGYIHLPNSLDHRSMKKVKRQAMSSLHKIYSLSFLNAKPRSESGNHRKNGHSATFVYAFSMPIARTQSSDTNEEKFRVFMADLITFSQYYGVLRIALKRAEKAKERRPVILTPIVEPEFRHHPTHLVGAMLRAVREIQEQYKHAQALLDIKFLIGTDSEYDDAIAGIFDGVDM